MMKNPHMRVNQIVQIKVNSKVANNRVINKPVVKVHKFHLIILKFMILTKNQLHKEIIRNNYANIF